MAAPYLQYIKPKRYSKKLYERKLEEIDKNRYRYSALAYDYMFKKGIMKYSSVENQTLDPTREHII